jgi:pimeloyl-ACP methyl ester carboxylesterase
MASVAIDGSRFEYVEAGSGDPLVLVHGSASDYRTWHAQRDAFAERFRTIAYSRRYHWPNRPIPEDVDYAMTEHVDDLQVVLRTLGATPAHLIGHSYGAFLCLLLALRAPRLVHTLVLAEPPVITLLVSMPPKLPELIKLLVTRPRAGMAIIKFGRQGVVPAVKAFRQGEVDAGIRTYGDAVFGRGGYHRLSESRKAQVQDNCTNVKAELLGPGFAPLDVDAVRSVDVPTLLVTGEQSIPLFRHLTDRLEELVPRSERTAIPDASHLMHEDNASAYNAVVLSFIRKHQQS